MAPWQTRVFWKVATAVDVERIDVAPTRRSRRGILRWLRASATRWSPSTWSRTKKGKGDTCGHHQDNKLLTCAHLPVANRYFVQHCPDTG